MTSTTPERRSAKAVFTAAMGLADPARRHAYVEAQCGNDAALRQQVAGLLAAAEASVGDNPLDAMVEAFCPESTANEATVLPTPRDVSRRREIGPYKLLEQIGEGGMGTVFHAQQSKPIRRKVALKIIKLGMDSRQVVARFEAERQALALMDHPNVARVLDAGTTELGQPYFVMELVKGVPITDYCSREGLDTDQRLMLFIDVCHGVQHAHQKGIIHRDLKPGNILVTLHDGKPVVKIIDFGVAKAVDQELTDRTLFTQLSQMIGTPMYMSPEQAEVNGLDIDTRSDVYSLGVLLYELLTGTTPFDRDTIKKAGIDEVRRMIRETEPQKPSQRCSTLKAGSSATTSTPYFGNRKCTQLELQGELDWIVMKALEKERDRRYESASAFAADVTRYLNAEPVLACPPGRWYRYSKLVRKHRTLWTTAVLFFAVTVTGAAGSIWQAIRATIAEQQAAERLVTLQIEQGRTQQALTLATSAELQQRRLRADAEAFAGREEAAAQLQGELRAKSELTEREAKWNLYVARLAIMQRAFEVRDYGKLEKYLNATVPSEGEADYRGWEWYYLRERINAASSKLSEGTGPVAWNPRGDEFATGRGEMSIIDIRGADTLQPLRTIDCQVVPLAMKWSPSGRMIAVGSLVGELCVVDGTDGTVIWSGRPVSVSNDGTNDGMITGLSWNSDDRRIAVANWFGAITIVDVEKQTTSTVRQPASISFCGHLDWHPDGNRLAAGLRFGVRTIFDIENQSELQLDTQSLEVGYVVSWSPSGEFLATSEGSRIRIADQTGLTRIALVGHVGSVVCAEWLDESTLISSSQDHTVRVWNTATGTLLDTIRIIDSPVDCLALDIRGRRIVCGTSGGTRRICSIATTPAHWVSAITTGDSSELTEAASDVASHKNSVVELRWSSDGSRLAAVGEILHGASVGGSCGIFNSAGLRSVCSYQTNLCKGLSWSLDGTQILRTAVVDQMRADDIRTGFPVQSASCPHYDEPIAFWSPDNQLVVSHGDGQLYLRNGKTLEVLQSWKHSDVAIGSKISWSPGGERFVAGGWGFPSVCEVDGRFLRVPAGRSGSFGIDWHPSGKVIALSGRTGIISLIDHDRLESFALLEGHTSVVNAVAFSPDGSRLASAGSDGTVRIWDFASGAELLQLTCEGISGFSQVVWSPDGLQLAAGTTLREVVIWDAPEFNCDVRPVASFQQGVVLTAAELRLGKKLESNKNIPPLPWRRPLAALKNCSKGFEAPVDRDRFDRMIEPLLSEVNNLPEQRDSLVRAWLILIEAHGDGESALFLADRLLHYIDQTAVDESAREQMLTYRLEALLTAGHRAFQLGRFGMAREFLKDAQNLAEATISEYPGQMTHWKRRIAVFLMQSKIETEHYLVQLREEENDEGTVNALRAGLKSLAIESEALSARIPSTAFHYTQTDKDMGSLFPAEAITSAELKHGMCPTFIRELSMPFEVAIERGNRDHYVHYQLALCRLVVGDLDGYRSVCSHMMKQVAETSDSTNLDFVCCTAAIAPDATDDFEPVIQLARSTANNDASDQAHFTCLGALLMRSGQFAAAKETLEKALKLKANWKISGACPYYFIAMTEHHLGNAAAARMYLTSANELADKDQTLSSRWTRSLTITLLRKEAVTLIDQSEH